MRLLASPEPQIVVFQAGAVCLALSKRVLLHFFSYLVAFGASFATVGLRFGAFS